MKVILYLEPVPEVLPPVRPLHEHRLRVELGVVLGLPEQHRVEIPANSPHSLYTKNGTASSLGPEHGEAAHHDGDDQDDQTVAQPLLRGHRRLALKHNVQTVHSHNTQ